MLQAQDLVLGFARFLGGSFVGSCAAGVSLDASVGLTSTKTCGPARGRQRPRRREHQIAGGTDHTQQGKVSYVAASPRSNSISNQESVACRVARAAELSLLSTPIGGREREPRRHRKTSFRRVAGRPCCAARAAKNSFFSQVATWPRWTTPTRYL